MKNSSRIIRLIAATLIVTMLTETVSPTVALALTDGPSQAEFVGSTGGGSMVDPFTGAFSYSIPVVSVPGPNGVGYGLTLNYANNLSPESEASWVGHGWSLNAGAINRIKRGYPDDYKDRPVKYFRNMRPNKTTTVALRGGVEAFSEEFDETGVNGMYTAQYNNYTGYDNYFDLGAHGLGASGNINFSENGVELDGDFKPISLLKSEIPRYIGAPANADPKEIGWGYALPNLARRLVEAQPGLKYLFGGNTFHPPARTTRHTGEIYKLSGGVLGKILPNTGWKVGLSGSWTTINPVPEYSESVYGYLYSNAASDEAKAMDYYVENDDHYSVEDRRLPLPFSNADYFAVSGAGVGGTFRAHWRNQGHFRPAKTEGDVDIYHLNVDVHVGEGFGIGGALGGGTATSTTKGWENNDLSFAGGPDDGEQVFFRFRGDRGGSILDTNDNAVQLNAEGSEWQDGATVWNRVNNGERVGRTTYVGYNTNSGMLLRPMFGCYNSGSTAYRSFSRRNTIMDEYVRRNEPAIADGIGEFAVVRGDGMTYIYGLPVYARDEVSMSYGLHGLGLGDIDHNYLAYKHVPPFEYGANTNLSGSESSTPYATTYLLTEIVSPDYVDRTNNGPTPDDLGGYVIFNYDRAAGARSKASSEPADWYKWRMPYRGTSYTRNSFSDAYDDAGSVAYGLKEIYYLESIETKTHRAVFHTSQRLDGYEAHHDEAEAAKETSAHGSKSLKKLDKIELWSKDGEGDPAKLLSTTYFDYDYSLCQGMPNAEAGGGKLTLKRVWFEYEGVVNGRISPYEFGYEYRPSSYFTGQGDIDTRYADIITHGDALSAEEQNPDYSPFNVDAWGNYQHNGAGRYEDYKPWVDQVPDHNVFDPAAWQLKWIKLPSGGEIHVQYEQNDYRHVQHRDAMIMVPLGGRKSSDPESDDFHSYELDLNGTGITDNTALVAALKKQFGDVDGGFVKDREYIYFRFFYSLFGITTPQLDQCNTEYISGYAAVTDVREEGGKVYIRLGSSTTEENSVPDKICKEFHDGARDGILSIDCGTPAETVIPGQHGNDEEEAWSTVYELLRNDFLAISSSSSVCKEINYEHSYLRIPTTLDKKGGGIRVKRVLTYDPGLEDEDVALYGTEYTYKTADGNSSGVAANEPAPAREENPLVRLGVPARPGADSVVSGKGMRQLEEPVGESLLPGASIGYSRVVVHNIHEGKSGPGFAVYEFHTAREYPFDMRDGSVPDPAAASFRNESTQMLSDRSEDFPIELVVYGATSISMNATQGFRFVLNNMHGQAKSISQYIGDYTNPGSATLTGQVLYEYFKPWETIPVMNGPSMTDITQAYPGKAVEVVTESRELIDDVWDAKLEGDYGLFLGFLFPWPTVSFAGGYRTDEMVLRTHVATKVIEYPVILKSVIATQRGITDRTDYAAFDPESGAPVLVKKYDGYHGLELGGSSTEHDGTYYSVGIPAWQHYLQFGQMAKTQNLILQSDDRGNADDGNTGLVFDKRFRRITSGDEHYLIVRTVVPGASKKLREVITTGDLIEIFQGPSTKGVYHVGEIGANRVELLPVSYSSTNNSQEVREVSIQIVKSARNNRVGASVGGFTTYGIAPQGTENPLQ